MEASRRGILKKHLEPARPLRRCIEAENGPEMSAATCAQAAMAEETTFGVEQLYRKINLHKKKERICYSREFLIGLASCPEAQKKPKYLPEHPVALSEVRDPGYLKLHEIRRNSQEKEMVGERTIHRE